MLRVRCFAWTVLARRSTAVEFFGLSLITSGLHEIYAPAALLFAGAALVLIAQGMERHE